MISGKGAMFFGRTLAAALLLWGLPITPGAAASNLARDLRIRAEAEPLRLALLLDRPPAFGFRPEGRQALLLTLYDTAGSPSFEDLVRESKGLLKLEGHSEGGDLGLRIALKGGLREVDSSWIAGEGILYLEVYSQDRDAVAPPPPAGRAVLKDIRFGGGEEATRMVLDLDRRPLWSVACREPGEVVLGVGALPPSLRKGPYGPMKRVRQVSLEKDEQGVRLVSTLANPSERLRVFWLQTGNRLVLDVMDRAREIREEGLRPSPRPGPEAETGPEPEAGAEVEVDAKPVPEAKAAPDPGSAQEVGIEVEAEVETDPGPGPAETTTRAEPRIGERAESPGPESFLPQLAPVLPSIEAEDRHTQDLGRVVRKKIVRPVPPASGVTGADGPPPGPAPSQPLEIEPRIDAALPESKPVAGEVSVDRLRPEEALLFGRILETRDLHDWEKGAGLIAEFLARFPESPAGERVAFLRGEFLFALFKSGKQGALPGIIQSYQDAISRYEGSREVPWAYIRMAQANVLAGNDYGALGYLGILLGRYKEGDHVALARLTRGKIYLRMKHPKKAIADFKAVLAGSPGARYQNEARYWIASYFQSVGMYKEAGNRLSEIAAADPEFYLAHPEYLFLCARNHFYLEEYDSARDAFFRALNIGQQPQSADLLLCHIGDTYQYQGQEKSAEKFYRLAADHFPESEGAAIAKLRLADHSSGVTVFEEIHQANADRPIGDLALLEMARRYYEARQWSPAMETLERFMTAPPRNQVHEEARGLYYRSVEKRITALWEAGAYQDLVDLYAAKQAMLAGNIVPEILLKVAQSFSRLGRHREAVMRYSQMKSYDFDRSLRGTYILGLAESYLAEGEDAQAERLLEESRKAELPVEDQQKVLVLLADMYRKRGALGSAYDLYRSLVGDNRSLPDREAAGAYYHMGEIAVREKRFEQAKEALNRCIALAEKDPALSGLLRSSFVRLGDCYHQEGRHGQAIRSYQKGFNSGYGPAEPDYWESKYRLALAYLAVGEGSKAQGVMGEISEGADALLQQKVEVKLGVIGLENQLKRLSIWKETGE